MANRCADAIPALREALRIVDEQDRLVCISRLTMAVVPVPGSK